MHAPFIRQVVQFCKDENHQAEYETLLNSAAQNGWAELANAVRQIVAGQRNLNLFHVLDEEDLAIAEAIMLGLQNPDTLPREDTKPEPALAAPGLAAMITAAASGDAQALSLIANMAEQMSKASGPLGHLASVIRPLINGERDPVKLCKGKNAQTEEVILNILSELGRTSQH
ncbi:MAG: hypothetical protein GY696_22685 [Gammaproteobacteria bacterium]|nr:hypothetical protein [Gammaproteobacteria bacterium]